MKVAWLVLAPLIAAQSDQTGTLSGTVTDAVTHVPVKKVMVSANPMNVQGQNQGPQSVLTDASGAFTLSGLAAGKYRVNFQHQSYPQARFGGLSKTVEVKAGDTAGILNIDLMPGSSVTGRIVDEDGDPIANCYVQVHPAKSPGDMVPMSGSTASNQEGDYRAYGIAPGKYLVSARCGQSVFQPRPFSSAAEPPPSRAYREQYYPLAVEPSGAQPVELTAGNEKPGVDFQMTPTAVTQVRGAFAPGGVDWHGRQLAIQLFPVNGRTVNRGGGMGAPSNPNTGVFQFRQVFPGSYMLFAFTQGAEDDRIGAWQRLDVGDKPMDVLLELKHGIDIKGRVEIENSGNATNKLTPEQINVGLFPQFQMGLPGSQTQVGGDGTFTLKGVMPAPHQVQVNGPNAFAKSVWLGSTDVTNGPVDLSGSAVGKLKVVVSTNTAAIRGSAPAGTMVLAQQIDGRGNRVSSTDASGQFNLTGLAPGKYRIMAMDQGGPMPDEGGQEITVREGETAVADLKPERNR
jgi:hypothetical protein